jgi:hypothetical protein
MSDVYKEFEVDFLRTRYAGPTAAEMKMAQAITRLRARVEVLEQHLRDAVSVADMAMSDANGCDCRTERKWDREAELEVFRAALKEAQP